MKKFSLALALALILVFVFSGCSKTPEATQPLSVGVLPDVDSIPLIVAQQQGFFEQEGLDITIQQFTSAPDRDTALQTGTIDGAVSDMLAAAFDAEGGFDVKITSMTNGSYKLLAGTSMGDSTDLTGKSIAMSMNTIIEYTTDRMLEQLGISPDNVAKTAIPQIPVRLEMLKSGQVDAATLPEPLASSAVLSGARIISSTDKLGINPGVLLFTKQAVETKSAEIQAFYRAYNKAVKYIQETPLDEYIDDLITAAKFPDDVKGVLSLPSYTQAALPSKADFDSVIAWLSGKGLIKNTYLFDDLISKDFAK